MTPDFVALGAVLAWAGLTCLWLLWLRWRDERKCRLFGHRWSSWGVLTPRHCTRCGFDDPDQPGPIFGQRLWP